MSVLDRDALEASPLADLHAIASELSIDGYRRLRRAELIDRILGEGDGGDAPEASASSEAAEDAEAAGDAPAPRRRTRSRRGGRARTEEPAAEARPEAQSEAAPEAEADAEAPEAAAPAPREEDTVEGVVELLPNGSGFIRVDPPEPSDHDVYVSAAQVKRCELVSGDRIAGPRRAPRRSERFASLVRVETVNGRPVEEATGGRFEDLPAAFATERLALGDEALAAVEAVAPFGRGSRVTIAGPAGSGKTELLRRIAAVLAAEDGVEVSIALAGVRPEEIAQWNEAETAPTSAVSFEASSDAQGHAVDLVVDQGRRMAARGAHVVVLIDTLAGLHSGAARRALAAARNIVDGGSLTVVATALAPVGGETTVLVLSSRLAAAGHFPAVDVAASRTHRAELLVGEEGAEAIVRARREAVEGRG